MRILLAILLLLMSWAPIPRPLPAAEPSTVPAEETIARWLDQLRSDRFQTREEATENLVRAGFPAIESVAGIVRNGGLEVASRGIHILRQLALSDEPSTGDAAAAALKQIAEGRRRVVGRRAGEALEKLNELRRQRAVAAIQRFGAKINTSQNAQVFPGFQPQFTQAIYTVHIDDDWKGGAKGLAHLKWLDSLTQVTLEGSKVKDSWLVHIEEIENLRSLHLKGAGITDAGVAGLKGLVNLSQISLEDCPVTEKGLAHLAGLPKLYALTIQGSQVSDAWLAECKRIAGLRILEVKRSQVTDEGLAHLKALPRLEQLSLFYSPMITDEAVDHLKDFKAVMSFKIYGTRVTKAGAERLRLALGDVGGDRVDYRAGGFLGIGCLDDPRGCIVRIIHPNSAAARAGLQPGDIVTKYDGNPAPDFKSLTALIAEHAPGHKIKLSILRNGNQTIEKEIALGQWD